MGRSPSTGTLLTLEVVARLTSPPMTKLSPSASSTEVSARRVRMAGTVTPLMVTPLLKSRSLASGETFRAMRSRSEEHTSELQSQSNLVCRLLLEKKKKERHMIADRYSIDCQMK